MRESGFPRAVQRGEASHAVKVRGWNGLPCLATRRAMGRDGSSREAMADFLSRFLFRLRYRTTLARRLEEATQRSDVMTSDAVLESPPTPLIYIRPSIANRGRGELDERERGKRVA